jgi:2-polyprenyl-3-methyl-5-hydroxy-6-metoxy-1,4-benzoquinol methylase
MSALLFKNEPGLGPELYDEHYFQHTLPGIEHLDDEALIDGARDETVRFGGIGQGSRVLDFGCGRGSLAIALAQLGAHVVGVDYSPHAIKFAQQLKARFPKEIQSRVTYYQMSMEVLNFNSEFDTIVLNQVFEHLRNWELELLLGKFRQALKPDGAIVISTPNLDYIRYLFPLKRMVNLPFKIMKESLRIVRGKSKHASSPQKFFKEIFKVRYPESEHNALHINMQTPASIQKFLSEHGFQVKVACVDPRKNLIGQLAKPWWGETIWVSCKIR